jgi:poly(A) polymerase
MIKPSQKVDLPAVLTVPGLRHVMQAIGGDQSTPQSLFVGGIVRNTLMGMPPGDVDIATMLTPDVVTDRLREKGIKVVPTGIEHGTVTAVADGIPYEVTTLRRDVSTDGRRAVVAFTDDWAADAARRDFTVNALYADIDGNIYDPAGQGIGDIKARRIRFVGNAAQRVAEDYLRILRFFRFHLYYGQGAPDEDALQACRAAADKISLLSRERITHEFLKILSHDSPQYALEGMFGSGIMADFPAPDAAMDAMPFLTGEDPLSRVFMLSGLKDRDVSPWLVLSGGQKKDLKNLHSAWIFLAARAVDEGTVKEAIYRFGRGGVRRAHHVFCATRHQMPDRGFEILIDSWVIPVFPVTGDSLIAQGLKPGAELGRRLKALEEEWILRGFIGAD